MTRHSGIREPERVALIVEDDHQVAHAIARRVPESLHAVVVHSVEAARGVLATPVRLAVAVVDIGLPDGSGLEIVRVLRERGWSVPVLVLTARIEAELINEAHRLDAEYVCKPDFGANLRAFFEKAAQRGGALPVRMMAAIRELASSYKLTTREREIIERAVGGVPRSHLAEVLGVTENTLKTQIGKLLEKTHQTSLSEVVWKVRGQFDERHAAWRDNKS